MGFFDENGIFLFCLVLFSCGKLKPFCIGEIQKFTYLSSHKVQSSSPPPNLLFYPERNHHLGVCESSILQLQQKDEWSRENRRGLLHHLKHRAQHRFMWRHTCLHIRTLPPTINQNPMLSSEQTTLALILPGHGSVHHDLRIPLGNINGIKGIDTIGVSLRLGS